MKPAGAHARRSSRRRHLLNSLRSQSWLEGDGRGKAGTLVQEMKWSLDARPSSRGPAGPRGGVGAAMLAPALPGAGQVGEDRLWLGRCCSTCLRLSA